MSRPHRLAVLAAAAALAAGAAACGDEPAKPSAPTPLRPGPQAPAAGTTAPAGRAAPPVAELLPEVDPLTLDASRRILLEAAQAGASLEAEQDAVAALAATAGLDTARSAAAKMLAPGAESGGYADAQRAALALHGLLLAGDPEAAAQAVALAGAALETGDTFPALVPLLAAVTGPQRAAAEGLLVKLAADEDVFVDSMLPLAAARARGLAERFGTIASDAEEDVLVRAGAAAGLLLLGDPRAETLFDAIVRGAGEDDEAAPDMVLAGLAVPGAPELLPWMHRLADPVIEEDENSYLEIQALAANYVDAVGVGRGAPEHFAALSKLLGRNEGVADDEVKVALWSLGDDRFAEDSAQILARYVQGVAGGIDEDLAIRILGALAARGGAGRPPFARVVDAAAQVPIPADPRRPDAAGRAWRVRVAAARAHIAAQK